MIAGNQGVELDPSKHVCAEREGEGTGVNSVDIASGVGTSPPMPEVRAYEVGTEELSNTFSVKGRMKAKLAFWRNVLNASLPPL